MTAAGRIGRTIHAAGGVERAHAVVPRVLVFFDYACQFCYLDWPRFKRLRAEHDAELFLVPFELRPQLPDEGVADRLRSAVTRSA